MAINNTNGGPTTSQPKVLVDGQPMNDDANMMWSNASGDMATCSEGTFTFTSEDKGTFKQNNSNCESAFGIDIDTKARTITVYATCDDNSAKRFATTCPKVETAPQTAEAEGVEESVELDKPVTAEFKDRKTFTRFTKGEHKNANIELSVGDKKMVIEEYDLKSDGGQNILTLKFKGDDHIYRLKTDTKGELIVGFAFEPNHQSGDKIYIREQGKNNAVVVKAEEAPAKAQTPVPVANVQKEAATSGEITVGRCKLPAGYTKLAAKLEAIKDVADKIAEHRDTKDQEGFDQFCDQITTAAKKNNEDKIIAWLDGTNYYDQLVAKHAALEKADTSKEVKVDGTAKDITAADYKLPTGYDELAKRLEQIRIVGEELAALGDTKDKEEFAQFSAEIVTAAKKNKEAKIIEWLDGTGYYRKLCEKRNKLRNERQAASSNTTTAASQTTDASLTKQYGLPEGYDKLAQKLEEIRIVGEELAALGDPTAKNEFEQFSAEIATAAKKNKEAKIIAWLDGTGYYNNLRNKRDKLRQEKAAKEAAAKAAESAEKAATKVATKVVKDTKQPFNAKVARTLLNTLIEENAYLQEAYNKDKSQANINAVIDNFDKQIETCSKILETEITTEQRQYFTDFKNGVTNEKNEFVEYTKPKKVKVKTDTPPKETPPPQPAKTDNGEDGVAVDGIDVGNIDVLPEKNRVQQTGPAENTSDSELDITGIPAEPENNKLNAAIAELSELDAHKQAKIDAFNNNPLDDKNKNAAIDHIDKMIRTCEKIVKSTKIDATKRYYNEQLNDLKNEKNKIIEDSKKAKETDKKNKADEQAKVKAKAEAAKKAAADAAAKANVPQTPAANNASLPNLGSLQTPKKVDYKGNNLALTFFDSSETDAICAQVQTSKATYKYVVGGSIEAVKNKCGNVAGFIPTDNGSADDGSIYIVESDKKYIIDGKKGKKSEPDKENLKNIDAIATLYKGAKNDLDTERDSTMPSPVLQSEDLSGISITEPLVNVNDVGVFSFDPFDAEGNVTVDGKATIKKILDKIQAKSNGTADVYFYVYGTDEQRKAAEAAIPAEHTESVDKPDYNGRPQPLICHAMQLPIDGAMLPIVENGRYKPLTRRVYVIVGNKGFSESIPSAQLTDNVIQFIKAAHTKRYYSQY